MLKFLHTQARNFEHSDALSARLMTPYGPDKKMHTVIVSKKIVKSANVSPSTRCSDLTDEEVTAIRALIDADYQTEGDLRRTVSQNIKRLTEIGSATGRRHRVGLPVRGQRTRTNARTRKGKVKIPVAKKK